MGNPSKKERNKDLVKLRNKGLSWGELASRFNIRRQTALKIYQRIIKAK